MPKPKYKRKTVCQTKYCSRDSQGRKHCSSCRSKKWREAHPIEYSYANIRNRARQRGKPFTISLEYFRQWCFRTQYIKGKGRTADGYSVDCKINELGYVEGNLQVLTLSKNASKGDGKRVKKLEYDWMTKNFVVTDNATTNIPDDDEEDFF